MNALWKLAVFFGSCFTMRQSAETRCKGLRLFGNTLLVAVWYVARSHDMHRFAAVYSMAWNALLALYADNDTQLISTLWSLFTIALMICARETDSFDVARRLLLTLQMYDPLVDAASWMHALDLDRQIVDVTSCVAALAYFIPRMTAFPMLIWGLDVSSSLQAWMRCSLVMLNIWHLVWISLVLTSIYRVVRSEKAK